MTEITNQHNPCEEPKVIAFIAMSLDGYVADKNFDVSWLKGDGSDPDNAMGSFPSFYETIDTIILGRTTYQQIITELSPDEWAYQGKQSYVLTSQDLSASNPSPSEIHFTKQDLNELVMDLKAKSGNKSANKSGNIWVCGGANIVQQFIARGLIDRFHISVIPMILGGGVPLFAEMENPLPLKLISTQNYNGITDLVYELR